MAIHRRNRTCITFAQGHPVRPRMASEQMIEMMMVYKMHYHMTWEEEKKGKRNENVSGP